MDDKKALRTRSPLDGALEILNENESDLRQRHLSADLGREKFFDRLALGSGAAITAIVSFLGAHSAGLHPEWALRCSLIALALTMCAALYRNLLYPRYRLHASAHNWLVALRRAERVEADSQIIKRGEDSVVYDDWRASLERDDPAIKETAKRADILSFHFLLAELISVLSACVAMVALVWLALRNF
jgi:hypothetical protein